MRKETTTPLVLTLLSSLNVQEGDDEEDQEEEEQQRGIDRLSVLPQEILALIRSFLFTKDRLAFNSLCKATKSIQNPALTFETSKHRPSFTTPYLLLHGYIGGSSHCACTKLFHSGYNYTYNVKIPELNDAEIHCSKFGWLLVSTTDDDRRHRHQKRKFFFFNPLSTNMNRIDIDIGPNYDIIALSFPFPPTISDWSIFGIFQSDDPLLRHQIILGNINSGERQSWHYKYFVNQNNIRISNGTLVYQDDQYYCLDVKGRVYAVQDPHGDNITFKYWCRPPIFKVGPSRVGAAPSRFLDTNQSFLAAGLEEDGGGIFAVIVSRDETKVSVYEFCRRECKWFPVENLRGRMLFVSETASFVAKATNPRMSNKIYFPKFYGASGVFYSLKTKKYHSYDGRFSSKESYTLQDMPSTATWIQPSLPLPEDLSFNF